uniref:Putative HAUS augmin-like complex subunit 4 n=1 Tax=Helianthus annuus TaxID=4232 RepID=A0A251ULL5_HELAN
MHLYKIIQQKFKNPKMAKSGSAQNLPADVTQLIDQLDRHCLAPDGSLVTKSVYNDLQLAREEMFRESLRYLEAMAIGMVEDYQQAVSVANLGGIRDRPGLHSNLSLKNSPQVYEALEHRLVVAEAAQRLRLPLISKHGQVHEEEIEKMSRSSLDSTCTSITITSTSSNYTNVSSINTSGSTNIASPTNASDAGDFTVGGVPNRFLGITPAYLWQTQVQHAPLAMDVAEYQMPLLREIEFRLKSKCDKLADAFIDDSDKSTANQNSGARLPERFVLEQILGVLIKLVKDLKLRHQHQYDALQKTWLCKRCETMSAKLRALEHILLLETYTQESVPALHKIRKYLVVATEEASLAYNKAVTRLREYQGVDPHFDTIARQYQDMVKKLENMQWTIHQVEMDLHRLPSS